MVAMLHGTLRSPTIANTLYRYVVDHDMGFSPNPFHGYCTLANCKPVIRRCAGEGDFILGFGAADSDIRYRLLYWMRVEEIMSYDKYWADERFSFKKPVLNGSHLKFHGDNIYHSKADGDFIQEPSFHSMPDGSPNPKNIKVDTGSTHNVLISRTFGYYGKHAFDVPEILASIVAEGRGHRVALSEEMKSMASKWLLEDTPRGYVGEPSGWEKIR